jgi:Cdc6-like AAA superfamily ATPase
MAPDPARPSRSILSDQPAADDQLNFAPYAKTLADILADPATDTPLTIGVFGGWGRGKTSLMRMVERRLDEQAAAGFTVKPVWFNAWLYSHQESLWRALIARVVKDVYNFPSLNDGARARLRQLEARLYQASTPASVQMAMPAGTLKGLDAVALPPLMGLELLRRQAQRENKPDDTVRLSQWIADMEDSDALTRRDQIAALDDFRREFEEISQQCIVDHGRVVGASEGEGLVQSRHRLRAR